MFINILLLLAGTILVLLGIINTIVYINKNKDYKGYKNTKGCVVEHVSKEGYHYFDDEEFGMDAINYVQDGINSSAGVVEFVIKNKKYRIIDSVNDTNLMPIGSEVMIKYNPRKIKDAFIVDKFDGMNLYFVGIFLIIIGILIWFYKDRGAIWRA